jgi:hypothetical protein
MTPCRPLALLLGILYAHPVSAYILPATSILRRMIEQRDAMEVSSIRVDGTLTFFGAARRDAARAFRLASAGSEASSEAAMMLKTPGRCRLEVWTPDGSRVAAIVSHRRPRFEGTEIAALSAVVEQVCAILGGRSGSETEGRAALERHLDRLKVESRRPYLARVGGQIAYVMGGPSDAQPSFWVYKDSFLPARLHWIDADQAAWDLRLADYSSPLTGELFPRVVELSRNGELALRFNALKVNQAVLPDKLF